MLSFCAVVILTMLAAMSFDPRLMWDAAGRHAESGAGGRSAGSTAPDADGCNRGSAGGMNDQPRSTAAGAARAGGDAGVPQAQLHTRRPFHAIWMIPIVAALIAGYLGCRAISERGPTITISFNTADGLIAGQTR